MSSISNIKTFTTEILTSSDLNSWFSEIRTKANSNMAWLDNAQTFVKTQTFTPDAGNAITVTTGTSAFQAVTGTTFDFSSTGEVGGLLTAQAGLTVSAGNLTLSDGQAIAKRFDAGNSGTSLTLDWDDGNIQKITLTGNLGTLTLDNPQTGATYFLELLQDATGSRTVTWPAAVVWSGGTAPTLTTTANRKDCVVLFYNGVKYIGSVYAINVNDTT